MVTGCSSLEVGAGDSLDKNRTVAIFMNHRNGSHAFKAVLVADLRDIRSVIRPLPVRSCHLDCSDSAKATPEAANLKHLAVDTRSHLRGLL